MCLQVKWGCRPRIAKSDIVCYKVVEATMSENRWRSVFRCTEEPYDTPIEARNDSAKGFPLIGKLTVCRGTIHAGLHAFVSEDRAVYGMRSWGIGASGLCRVRRAVIPKGAEYCYGMENDVVANRMIVFGSDEAFSEYVSSSRTVERVGLAGKIMDKVRDALPRAVGNKKGK